MSKPISAERKNTLITQTQLDTVVLHIELTLISIIQGVALSFLVDHSYNTLVSFQIAFWPYVVTGLLIILLFWSRSSIHTLTVIRWPLDLGHNFMYVVCAMVEAVTFTQLTNTLHWYALNTLLGITSWILFASDLRLIRRRMSDIPGEVGSRLYAIVEREQLLNIRVFMPATVVFNLLAVIAVRSWPLSLIKEGGHVVIALIQLTAISGYLLYVMRFSARIIPLIEETRREWSEEIVRHRSQEKSATLSDRSGSDDEHNLEEGGNHDA